MQPTSRWISTPGRDAVLTFSWVPFALAAHLVDGRGHSLRLLFAGVMFASFIHQPLTFPLLFGSPWRLAAHRRMFLATPAVAVAVIVVATQLSMTLVAVVGGLWNLEHILMQRYGVVRMYGRKAGDDQGTLERGMLVGWFVVPLLWTVATGRLTSVLDRLSSGSVDADAARILARMTVQARAGFIVTLCGVSLITIRWLQVERLLGHRASRGKWIYVGSTAALFACAFVDPVAAVVGFVASHSVEYFMIVERSVAAEARHEGWLGQVSRRTHGRVLFFAGYGLVGSAVFFALYRAAPPGVLLVSVLGIGAVHFFYDAFIWKLRKPLVAASLAVTAPGQKAVLSATYADPGSMVGRRSRG